MEQKILIALFSIGFGWGLSQLSIYLSNRKSNKELYNKTVFNLLKIRALAKKYADLMQRFDNLSKELGSQQSEKFRREIIKAKDIDVAINKEYFINLINEISSIDPILGYKVKGHLEAILSIYDLEIKSADTGNGSNYKSLVTLISLTNETGIPIIEKIILRISLKASIIRWAKMKYFLKTEDDRETAIKDTIQKFEEEFIR